LQAAAAPAATFVVGAALPILTATLSPLARLSLAVSAVSLVCLAGLLGATARSGGASAWKSAGRVAFWGALAMATTAGAGALFGTTVS
jgi:VIT1/CCC1 family predicted Fe2+/Mn2+ transporter